MKKIAGAITPKGILRKLCGFVVIIQAIIIGGTLLLFPHPKLLVDSFQDWVQNLFLIILVEALIWPIVAILLYKSYNNKHEVIVIAAIRNFLIGPYVFAGGCIIIVVLLFSEAPEPREKIGYLYYKRTGEKIRDVYKNDNSNTWGVVGLGLVGGLMVFGGLGSYLSGIKVLRQEKKTDHPNQINQEPK